MTWKVFLMRARRKPFVISRKLLLAFGKLIPWLTLIGCDAQDVFRQLAILWAGFPAGTSHADASLDDLLDAPLVASLDAPLAASLAGSLVAVLVAFIAEFPVCLHLLLRWMPARRARKQCYRGGTSWGGAPQ